MTEEDLEEIRKRLYEPHTLRDYWKDAHALLVEVDRLRDENVRWKALWTQTYEAKAWLDSENQRLEEENARLRGAPEPVTCSECGALYQPVKKPRSDQAHYCATCRGWTDDGLPRNLAAKRRYAAKVRAK